MGFNTATVVRRGVEVARSTVHNSREVETWAKVVVFGTIIAFSVLLLATSYTYGDMVGTLAIIESPPSDAYLPINDLQPTTRRGDNSSRKRQHQQQLPLMADEDGAAEQEQEDILVKNSATTSSMRRTIRHLRSQHGYLSRFRGFGMLLSIAMIKLSFTFGIARLLPSMNIWGSAVVEILLDICLAQWYVGWVHAVIGEASAWRWWRRIPPLKMFPSSIRAVSILIAGRTVFGFFMGFSWGLAAPNAVAIMVITPILTVVLGLLFWLPSIVVFVRLAASMLPADAGTIVPFDRSFGGRVNLTTTASAGPNGDHRGAGAAIGVVDAWCSFDWPATRRLLKLVLKTTAIYLAIIATCGLVLFLELQLGGRPIAAVYDSILH